MKVVFVCFLNGRDDFAIDKVEELNYHSNTNLFHLLLMTSNLGVLYLVQKHTNTLQ